MIQNNMANARWHTDTTFNLRSSRGSIHPLEKRRLKVVSVCHLALAIFVFCFFFSMGTQVL